MVNECEAEWIFYQLEYLQIFDEILCDRLAPVKYKEIYEIVNVLVERFFKLFAKNKLLPVECLFVVKERNIKNQILSNYEEIPGLDAENDRNIEIELEDTGKRSKTVWNKEEDQVLIENYPTFKDMYNVFDLLADLIVGKTSKQIKKRVKFLKLSKGRQKATEIMNSNHEDDSYRDLFKDAVDAFEKHGKDTIIDEISKIAKDLDEFSQMFGNAEFVVVPVEDYQFGLYANKEFGNLLISLGFRSPGQGEWCWRVSTTAEYIRSKLQEIQNHEEPVYEDEQEYHSGIGNQMFQISQLEIS